MNRALSLVAITIAVCSPILLLHGLVFLRLASQDSMPPAEKAIVYEAQGTGIHYFRRAARNSRFRVVFIHDSPGDSHTFQPHLTRGIPQVELVTYDRPGFGQTSRLPDYSLQYQVRTLEPLLRLQPALPTVVVGHSYGGPVALRAALSYPGQVRGVVLLGASVAPELENRWWIQSWIDSPLLSWILPAPFLHSNREWLALRAELATLSEQYSGLNIPILMMHGSKDVQISVENVSWMETRMSQLGKNDLFQKKILLGRSHYFPSEHPDETISGIVDLMRRIP